IRVDLLLDPLQGLAEELGHIRDCGHGTLVVNARGAEYAERSLNLVVTRVGRADQGQVVPGLGDFLNANLDENRLWCFDAGVEDRNEAMLFLDSGKQFPQVVLIGKFWCSNELCSALDVDLLGGSLGKD